MSKKTEHRRTPVRGTRKDKDVPGIAKRDWFDCQPEAFDDVAWSAVSQFHDDHKARYEEECARGR